MVGVGGMGGALKFTLNQGKLTLEGGKFTLEEGKVEEPPGWDYVYLGVSISKKR